MEWAANPMTLQSFDSLASLAALAERSNLPEHILRAAEVKSHEYVISRDYEALYFTS